MSDNEPTPLPAEEDRNLPVAGGHTDEQPALPDPALPDPALPDPATHAPRPVSPQTPVGMIVAVSVVAAFIIGALAGGLAGFGGAHLALRGVSSTGAGGDIRVIPGETDEPVVAAAAAALGSVVNIDVSATAATPPDGELPQGHPGVPMSGNGSGVAFRRIEGGGTYILTNDHVVSGVDSIVITGVDGERHAGELVGTDPETDIAVIRTDSELPVIRIGDSESVEVGQLVIAIGSPYGLSQSVSSGVVSAYGRSLPDALGNDGVYPLVDVIQTDAAINPGNSGGALVDRTGALLGINTAIYSGSGASAGIGFAIPVQNAIRVADQLIAGEDVEHPFLGVVGQDVTAALAAEKSLPVQEGALVIEVAKGTNAERAGIRTNDLIVMLDDSPIRTMDDLILQVRRRAVGDTVILTVYRDGQKTEIEMTVGSKPKNLELPSEEATASP